MKKYEKPEIVLEMLTNLDVICTSEVGTETSRQDDNDGIWDLNIG